MIAESLVRPEAFARIFDRHFADVHRYLARRVGRDLADDLASQTFTIAFGRRHAFRVGAETAAPWLSGIATNLVREHRRAELRMLDKAARFAATAAVRRSVGADPTSMSVDVATLDASLAGALLGLDADQRDVLLLYAWSGLSYEEIADSLVIPVGTVRSRLSRARTHVRSELARETATENEETK